MIEIIYNKESDKKNEYLRLPKNIKQVGIPDEMRKIYIEDYAITYINQFSHKNAEVPKAAILIGYTTYNSSCEYIFTSGVLEAEEVEIDGDKISFSETAWTGIYDNIKKYFPGLDIVGWFLTSSGFKQETTDQIIKAHIDNFAGSDKVFMKLDALENEEIFYIFQNGRFVRQTGYYIYYEKNEEMQEYMVEIKKEIVEKPIEVVHDYAARNFRTIIQERKEEKRQKKIMTFMYTTSTFLMLIVIAIGVTMINNYDKMKNMEQALSVISQAVEKKQDEDVSAKAAEEWMQKENEAAKKTADKVQEEKPIPVQNIAGNVEKKEPEGEQEEKAEPKQPEQKEEPKAEDAQDTQPPAEGGGNVTEISSSEEEMKNNMNGGGEDAQDTPGDNAGSEGDAAEPQPEPRYYVVQEGDTLADISMEIYNTKDMVDAICQANNIQNVNWIMTGQRLLLP